MNVEFAIYLGSGLRWGKATVFCLCPVTDLFHLKIYWAEAQSYFVRTGKELFSVVFCLIRVVHKFDFRLVINEI